MPDDPREPYGRLVHDTRLAAEKDRAAAEGRQVFRLGTWGSRSGPQREADMRIGEAVSAAERDRIITLLQAQADREREASEAFPGDPGFIGAARAARVAVLIVKGEIGGEGMMP